MYLYILTDGENTKIGITGDLVRRLRSYTTHASKHISLHSKYHFDDYIARKLESSVKQRFHSKLYGQGKEWFALSPTLIDQFVKKLMKDNGYYELGPVRCFNFNQKLPIDLKDKIDSAGEKNLEPKIKKEIIDTFSSLFQLGIPQYQVEKDIKCLSEEDFSYAIDLDTIRLNSLEKRKRDREIIKSNYIQQNTNDYIYRFYSKMPLSNGTYYAFCSSIILFSEHPLDYDKGVEFANDYDLFFINNLNLSSWNWYDKSKHMYLFIKKNLPDQTDWDLSFRKWFIENTDILFQLCDLQAADYYSYQNFSTDVLKDIHFPLTIRNASDFFKYTAYYHSTQSDYNRIACVIFDYWLSINPPTPDTYFKNSFNFEPLESWLFESLNKGILESSKDTTIQVPWYDFCDCKVPLSLIVDSNIAFTFNHNPLLVYNFYCDVFNSYCDISNLEFVDKKYIRLPSRNAAMLMFAKHVDIDVKKLFPTFKDDSFFDKEFIEHQSESDRKHWNNLPPIERIKVENWAHHRLTLSLNNNF
ncbi:GIY-YIG nuclease family protein [Flavobacterium sp.]|jgi:hypothetical protein|uniref:GIY-YIG nuclease family protein n=1 Tax=Flavobacterium sp. TaxID=239 RepID=UPI0037BF5832